MLFTQLMLSIFSNIAVLSYNMCNVSTMPKHRFHYVRIVTVHPDLALRAQANITLCELLPCNTDWHQLSHRGETRAVLVNAVRPSMHEST